jgi:hypothetical protein
VDIAKEWADYILDGLDRSVTARLDGTVPPERVVDVQFAELNTDPMGVVARVYDQFGLELTPEAEGRMREFLAAAPHAGPGAHSYSFADTELDEGQLRERARRYQDHFAVPSEPLG